MGGAVEATSTPRMADLTVTDQVSGGQDVTVTVTLREKAPSGGVSIRLASSNTALSVSSNLTIRAGAKSATTTATTKAVRTRTKAVVSATYGGVTKTETVVISPIRLAAISAPATVTHGESAEVTISLTGPAPAGGVTVRLVGNRPSVLAVPATVTVPAGSTSAAATVTAFTHRGDADVTLTAKLSGSANEATIVAVLGTGFPDATATATATNTPEPTMTNTPEPTATNTPEPTATNTAEPTATETATSTATETATATASPTATNTAVPVVIQIVVPAGHSATISGYVAGADRLHAIYRASTGESGYLADNYFFGNAMPVQTSVFTTDTVLVIELTDNTCGRMYGSDGDRALVSLLADGYQVDILDSGGGTCSNADGARTLPGPGTGNFSGQVIINSISTATPTSTATEVPPTATNTPEPTATNTPEPTATNTVEPTATNTAEPTATNTVAPQSLTLSTPWGDGHYFYVDVCLLNPTATPVTVELTYSASSPMAWVDFWPGSPLTLSSAIPCINVQLHADNYDEVPWVVTMTATLNGATYSSAPMSFWLFG